MSERSVLVDSGPVRVLACGCVCARMRRACAYVPGSGEVAGALGFDWSRVNSELWVSCPRESGQLRQREHRQKWNGDYWGV